ncbi:uroporphyrinogen-III synthase [Pyrobaculum calidifontis]|uniref:Uroporphyrinogen III synthase HEM4 n=1 Tax=Pyrobaculum calidifontis (strain DSM 21063 / JCM 11548 / VA1) TaxID=410359 RepID=A3MW61_PYRCJ|nr:uroporphyrinogen-III synthase [Pyrobaculum calidifontis]ABO08878.1 Uroporphyrinogen III synthase HEM4 [Pyrobaculum calidifontis JCM 11548]
MPTVVITSGRAHKADLLAKMLTRAGIEPVYLPVVKIGEAGGADVAKFIDEISHFDVFIFMTGQSVASLVQEAKRAGLEQRLREALSRMTILCRGSKAAGNVKSLLGLTCAVVEETSEELLKVAERTLEGKRVAISFYGYLDDEFLREVQKRAAEVKYIQTYRTELEENAAEIAKLVLAGEADVVVFTSALACNSFFTQLSALGLAEKVANRFRSGAVKLAAVGPVTAEECKKFGVEPHIVPEKPFLAYLGEAIIRHLKPTLNTDSVRTQ